MFKKGLAFGFGLFIAAVALAGLESATYINQLNPANPTITDHYATADDHLRLIKGTLQATFPNIAGEVTATQSELNILDGVTATAAELNALDGITSTATELNLLDGLESQTAITGLPQNSRSANYTLVAGDAGKHILHPSGGGAGDTFTIPSNSIVAFPLGTIVCFVNEDSNTITVAITSDTMVLAGSSSTGSRTVIQNGVGCALKTGTTRWLFNGTGVS